MKNASFFLALFLCCLFSLSVYSQCNPAQNTITQFFHNNRTYEIIRVSTTWEDAAACAVHRGGHLVQIDDQAEQTAIFNELNADIPSWMYNNTIASDGGNMPYVWMGANDIDTEGTWDWHGSNTNFWTGEGSQGNGNGMPVGWNTYQNWGRTTPGIPNEPDNWSNPYAPPGPGQDAAAIALTNWQFGTAGQWNDVSIDNTLFFVIEYDCAPTGSIDIVSSCGPHTWIDGITYTSNNNSATHILTNEGGCDSIISLHLTINNTASSTDSVTGCDSYTWIDGNTYTTNNNTATHVLNSVHGCDSIVTLNLTINNSTSTDVHFACNSFTWIDGNTYTSSNNTATDTLINSYGCDSIIFLDLIIYNTIAYNTHIISDESNNVRDVYPVDLDADGDLDVLCASYAIDKITWFENDGSQSFTVHEVGTDADGAHSVFASDVDNDGDLDVLSANYHSDEIVWYENDGNQDFTAHPISSSAIDARDVYAIDLDADGDMDVLSASSGNDEIVWYENNGSQNFISHTISNNANYAFQVFASDVDSDGDIDVLSASILDNKIAWYENNGSESFTTHNISTSASQARDVRTIDIDGDGDLDVLGALHDRVVWYENDGNQNFTPHDISINVDNATSVYASDMDLDGDIDVLSTSTFDGKIAWYENDGNQTFTTHNISNNLNQPKAGYALDFDLDGDVDVLCASTGDHKVIWYENSYQNNVISTGIDTVISCDSYTWIDGNTYNSSNNTATHTLTNEEGCDSIVTLNLTIKNSSHSFDVHTACDSFTWIDGNTYTSDNNEATHILTNSVGCDSVVTLNLTIKNSSYSLDVNTACDSFTWIDGNTYTSSNYTATHTLSNSVGCDSIIYLDLTIYNSYSIIDEHTTCESFTWIDGNTYTSSNNFSTYTLTSVNGCDSIVTLNLTINNTVYNTDAHTACDSFTWIDDNTYTSSNNTATHTLSTVNGCDSIIYLDLTMHNSYSVTDEVTYCESYTWIDGNTYTSSNNTATHTLTSVNGCDSIVTLNLIINNITSSNDEQVACAFYTWIDGNTYTSDNNEATHILTNSAGCDSVVTLDLTMASVLTGTDVQSACETFTWIDGNIYTSSNNTATHTLTSVNGCDSIVTLNLTIYTTTFGTDVRSNCGPFTWIDGNTYNSSNNTATHTLTSVYGCDSIVTLNLTVNNSSIVTDVRTACGSFTWINGHTYTSNNNSATYTLTSVDGCDSIILLDLSINDAVFSTDVRTACDSFTWINGHTYTSNNNSAAYTITNSAGCDSVIILDLTIVSPSYSVDEQTVCESLTWIDGNTYSSSNYSATHTLSSVDGCDSIVTLNLEVEQIDVSIYLDGSVIIANNNDATYQWLDCDDNFNAIPLETNQELSASAGRNYAVELIQGNCIDTSECINIVVADLEHQYASQFVLFPNPNRGSFNILFDQHQDYILVTIHSMIGQQIVRKEFSNVNAIHLEIDGSDGIYFIDLNNGITNISRLKVIKE